MAEMNLVIIDQEKLVELIKSAVDNALTNHIISREKKQDDEIFTRKEAALFLSLTPGALSAYVRDGKIKAGILSGKYRFKKSDLMNYVFSLKN